MRVTPGGLSPCSGKIFPLSPINWAQSGKSTESCQSVNQCNVTSGILSNVFSSSKMGGGGCKTWCRRYGLKKIQRSSNYVFTVQTAQICCKKVGKIKLFLQGNVKSREMKETVTEKWKDKIKSIQVGWKTEKILFLEEELEKKRFSNPFPHS